MWILLLSLVFGAEICDLSIDESICLYDGLSILQPNSIPEGLVGDWTFDDILTLDYSGRANHAKITTIPGEAIGGRGASGKYTGETYTEIEHNDSLSADIFTVSFWLFLKYHSTIYTGNRWCPILQKGEDTPESSLYERAPAIFLDRQENAIRGTVSTEEDAMGEFVDSYARIPYERWTAITLVRGEGSLYLYVNGILDNTNTTSETTATNQGPFYIGSTPDALGDCPITLMVDSVKFFNRELTEDEIEAYAAGALGQIEPRFVKLGCVNCNLLDAADACYDNYHLCTTIELHSGAFSVAKANGWTKINPKLWSHSALSQTYDEKVLGLGVCCRDLGT